MAITAQRANGGILFSNRKDKDTQPDYRGRANVNGTDCEVVAWTKQAKNGMEFLSLSFKPWPTEDSVPF